MRVIWSGWRGEGYCRLLVQAVDIVASFTCSVVLLLHASTAGTSFPSIGHLLHLPHLGKSTIDVYSANVCVMDEARIGKIVECVNVSHCVARSVIAVLW